MKHRLKMLWHRFLKALHLCPLSVLQARQADVRILESLNRNQCNRLVRHFEFLRDLHMNYDCDGTAGNHSPNCRACRAKELLP